MKASRALRRAAVLLPGLLLACREPPPPPAPPPVETPPPVAPETPVAPEEAVFELPDPGPADLAAVDAARLAEYAERRPRTTIELQPFRQTSSALVDDGAGRSGVATLTDLNPHANTWFLLRTTWDDGTEEAWHLESPDPRRGVRLGDEGLVISDSGGVESCRPWLGDPSSLAAARAGGEPYAALCGGKLYLRNPTEGRKTKLERATDFLRDNVWGGEKIVVFVREELYQDAFLESPELQAPLDPERVERPRPSGAPPRPAVDPRYDGLVVEPRELGLELVNDVPGRLLVGRWFEVRGQPDVYLSTLQAEAVAHEVADAQEARLNPLDDVELHALAYLVAFDLDGFDVAFALGTDHPRLGWSERAEAVIDPALPGPDGVDSAAPLVRTGQVPPVAARRVAATFTGGFKRAHGAFKYGPRAKERDGTHYGFVEQGTVFSKLQPGLATVVVWDDGTTELLTWSEADDARLGHVRHARQNGPPLVERDPATGEPRVGGLVRRWSEGNWSGSQDQRLRTLRAGLCQVEDGERRFLVYGYFSSATPSAMALVFAAYGCSYALMTDINALEHTYLALYRRTGDHFLTRHLIGEMRVLDREEDGQELPRFVAFADNRDFFYLTRKDPS